MSTLSKLTPHELLELHELINNELTCTKKLQASLALIKDRDLHSFMESSIQLKKDTLNNYREFYTNSEQH